MEKRIKYLGFLLIIVGVGWLCHPPDRFYKIVVVKGSDTEVNLALTLAETYMAKDPNISIAVTGGGSGAGIASLINGKTDIANSSRPMTPAELTLAKERNIQPIPIIFAVDALALIVEKEFPLDSLTVEQAADIFSGKILNWKELGGADMTISLYGRQSNSGTFVFFRDSIVKAEYALHHKQMNGTAQIVDAIRHDPAGIGYVGVGYVKKRDGSLVNGLKVLGMKRTATSPAVSPLSTPQVVDGAYPIVRPLFQYVNGLPSGKLLDFILFCLSPEGQQIVADNGYYPISTVQQKQNQKAINQ
jgi:phosphate transport system substrate-binding protein